MQRTIGILSVFLVAGVAWQGGPGSFTYQTTASPPKRLSDRILFVDDESGCEFNRIAGAVVMPDNSIVVANAGSVELCLISGSGRAVHRIGRGGAGPGEFRGLFSIGRFADSIVAYDHILSRLSVFNSKGRFVRSFSLTRPIGIGGSLMLVEPQTDGRVLAAWSEIARAQPRPEPIEMMARVYEYSRLGVNPRAIGRFAASENFVQPVPPQFGNVAYWNRAFGRSLSFAALAKGYAISDGREFRVTEYGASGVAARQHLLAERKRPVSDDDIKAYKERTMSRTRSQRRTLVAQMLREMPFPKEHPAVERILGDRNAGVWAELHTLRGRGSSTWVFIDTQARKAAEVTLPNGFAPRAAASMVICGTLRDDMDREALACYRFAGA